MCTQQARQFFQYFNDFPPLGVLDVANFIVDLQHLCRLNIYRLPGGRFIHNKTAKLSLVFGEYRYDRTPIANRYRNTVGYPTLGGSLAKELIRDPPYTKLFFPQQLSQAGQFHAGMIFNLTGFINF